jgi:hypothetical protein
MNQVPMHLFIVSNKNGYEHVHVFIRLHPEELGQLIMNAMPVTLFSILSDL